MQQFIMQNQLIIWAIIIWALPWKGIALWRAAKNNQLIWFIILFLINTLAILDIIYIIFVGKDKKEEATQNNQAIPINGVKIV
jgi:membrane protein DedA with SNARE-associated domain